MGTSRRSSPMTGRGSSILWNDSFQVTLPLRRAIASDYAPNPIAPWELRIGHLRVYFDVEHEPRPLVRILAVGVKDRDRVSIGGEDVELK